MDASIVIRDGTRADADACAGIYAPYVQDTAISFELTPPAPEQMWTRMDRSLRSHAWLVADLRGVVIGYAYGGPFRTREAYRWACETSIYLDPGRQGAGLGRELYAALLRRLTERGYRTALAGMTEPNDASTGLHRALGYEPAGTYRGVGWKNGAWHDVTWFQKSLADRVGSPVDPT